MINGHPMHVVLPEETISHADLCDAAGFDDHGKLDVSYNLPGAHKYVPLVAGDDAPLVDGASYSVRVL